VPAERSTTDAGLAARFGRGPRAGLTPEGMPSVRVLLPLAAAILIGCGSPAPSSDAPRPAPVVREATIKEVLGPWQAAPFRLPPGFILGADQACRRDLAADLPAGIVIAVADARGAGVVQLWYVGPNGASATCNDLTLGPDGSWVWMGGGSTGHQGAEWPAIAANAIVITDDSAAGRPITRSYLAGRSGAAIVAVRILRPGLIPVEASVANAWWGAWVEGAFPPQTVIRGYGAAGQVLAEANPDQ
jgi:hypothetical protein